MNGHPGLDREHLMGNQGHQSAAARRRRLRRKIVTVHVEDTHFRVTCDGAEISLHPGPIRAPSPDGRPRSTPRNPSACPATPEPVNQVVSRNCQSSPETTRHTFAAVWRGPTGLAAPSAADHVVDAAGNEPEAEEQAAYDDRLVGMGLDPCPEPGQECLALVGFETGVDLHGGVGR